MAQRTPPYYRAGAAGDDGEQSSPRRSHPAAAAFMAAFLVAGLLLSLANPALLRAPREPLLDGSWTAAYQQAFDEASPLFDSATAIWAVLEYVVFQEGRPGVLVGDDDWLFSTEEFQHPPPASAHAALEHNLDEIAAIAERLRAEGIHLLVALVPAKARIYPETLGRYTLPPLPAARYRLALSGLAERGVPIVDLAEALVAAKGGEDGEVFLRTDTHWTPYGAAAAAEAVAAALEDLSDFSWLGNGDYERVVGETVAHRGDLTRFLPLGRFYDALGPRDDRLRRVATTAADGPGDDLFAAVDLPVALLGTSYSADDRWNFAGELRRALGTDLLLAAEQGRGPISPMRDYLESAAFISSPPAVVVWEVPERYLFDEPERGGSD